MNTFIENPELLVSGPQRANYFHRVKFNRDENGWNYVIYKYQDNIKSVVLSDQVPSTLHDVMVVYTSHRKVDKAVSTLLSKEHRKKYMGARACPGKSTIQDEYSDKVVEWTAELLDFLG